MELSMEDIYRFTIVWVSYELSVEDIDGTVSMAKSYNNI